MTTGVTDPDTLRRQLSGLAQDLEHTRQRCERTGDWQRWDRDLEILEEAIREYRAATATCPTCGRLPGSDEPVCCTTCAARERRTVTRAAFHADPARYILAAEREGPIEVVDDEGRVRVVLSSPLAQEPRTLFGSVRVVEDLSMDPGTWRITTGPSVDTEARVMRAQADEIDRLRSIVARVEALADDPLELDVPGGIPGYIRCVDVEDLRAALASPDTDEVSP